MVLCSSKNTSFSFHLIVLDPLWSIFQHSLLSTIPSSVSMRLVYLGQEYFATLQRRLMTTLLVYLVRQHSSCAVQFNSIGCSTKSEWKENGLVMTLNKLEQSLLFISFCISLFVVIKSWMGILLYFCKFLKPFTTIDKKMYCGFLNPKLNKKLKEIPFHLLWN